MSMTNKQTAMMYESKNIVYDKQTAMDGPAVKKRKGQRIRLNEEPVLNPPVVESLLATFLLKKCAWGFMTPQLIQEIASLAMQDFSNAQSAQGQLKSLNDIAKIGGSGSLENNMHRDLANKFLQNTMIPKGLTAMMPFKGMQLQEQTIMLPHAVFSSFFHCYPNAWESTMLPNPNILEEFWAAQADHPATQGHPIASQADKSKYLPLGLHGDEVPITGKGKVWSKSALTFEWLSLLGATWGPTRMIWIWGGFDKLLDTSDTGTLAVLFKILSWSLYWLQEGKWPTHNWKGEEYESDTEEGIKAGSLLANGYCGVVWAIMGDLDFFAKSLQLPRSTSHNPCSLCKCTLNGENTWKDFSAKANWLQQQWSPAQWNIWPDKSKVDLFSVPGISAANVALDYMHNKYLGTDQQQFGSTLYVLCFLVLPGSPQENLLVCWGFIKQHYRDHHANNRYGSITKLSMFLRKSGVIKLRGKAAELKGLCFPLLDLWKAHMNTNLSIHRKIKLMLQLNCQMETILDTYSDCYKLPMDVAKEFLKCGFLMYEFQKELRAHFQMDEGCTKTVFSLTSKAHMVLHACLLSGMVSPRLVWCFMAEDFMRRVQRLGECCVRGVKNTNVSQKMMQHYRLGLDLELAQFK